jgi:hypothetical protein
MSEPGSGEELPHRAPGHGLLGDLGDLRGRRVERLRPLEALRQEPEDGTHGDLLGEYR